MGLGKKKKKLKHKKVKKSFWYKRFQKRLRGHFDDKVIHILKRAVCSDEERREYKEKINSEMELSELLEDLVKVLYAAKGLKRKKK